MTCGFWKNNKELRINTLDITGSFFNSDIVYI